MPLTTHLDIFSAEALILSGPVTKVVIPAEAGANLGVGIVASTDPQNTVAHRVFEPR